MTKLASVAMDLVNDKQANLDKMTKYVREAAAQGAELIVFPEMALGGLPKNPMFIFNPEDALYQHEVAEEVPAGPSTQHMIELAKELGIYIIWGMVERDAERWDVLYNSVVMVGPKGFEASYHKVHQPLTERIMFHTGDADWKVVDTPFGKVGIMCCFDKAYPEVSRALALKGADILVCPTAWPAIEQTPEDNDYRAGNIFSYARALENMCFFIDSCVSGQYEMGHSRILGPNPGQLMATTSYEEGMAIADCDIQGEIKKARICSMAGSNLLKDRKPLCYMELVQPNNYNPFSGDIGQFGPVCQ